MDLNVWLEYFKDINYVYNDCMRHDELKRSYEEVSLNSKLDILNRIRQEVTAMNAMKGNFISAGYSFYEDVLDILDMIEEEVHVNDRR